MKKFLAFVLSLAMVLSCAGFSASAEEAPAEIAAEISEMEAGEILEFEEYDDHCVVTGIGSCTDPEIVIPAIYNGKPVTAIGDDAFHDCSGLRSVVIPEGVTRLGSGAFLGCSNLENVVIPDGVTMIGGWSFRYCSSLKSITVPESVSGIGSSAFYGCSALTDLFFVGSAPRRIGRDTFPEDVTLHAPDGASGWTDSSYYDAGNGTWHGYRLVIERDASEGLTFAEYDDHCVVTGIGSCTDPDVIIPAEYNGKPVTAIGEYAFFMCSSMEHVSIPNSVTAIEDGAFSSCSRLTSAGIPISVTVLGDGAFQDCSSLTHVTIPERITEISARAFERCTGLTGITIPGNVTKIGEYAFYWCNTLESAVIPESVTEIGKNAFGGCARLANIAIPAGVISIDPEAFDNKSIRSITVAAENPAYLGSGNCLIEKETKTLVMGCAASVIPADGSVAAIGNGAFEYCSGLTSAVIPAGVTVIGDRAFYSCDGLTELVIPEGVTSIGQQAFSGCAKLTGITLPGSITSVGNGAFEYCSALTELVISEGVTSIGQQAFTGCTKLTKVTIPASVGAIGDYAFYYCSRLTDVYFAGNAPSMRPEYLPFPLRTVFHVKASAAGWTDNPKYNAEAGVWYAYPLVIEAEASRGLSIAEYDDHCVVTGIGSCTDTAIIIPDTYNGKPVTEIGVLAFLGHSELTRVVIPAGVTTIGASAFKECRGLISVEIPKTVNTIGAYAFDLCDSLTGIMLPEGVTEIGDSTFWFCSGLESIRIPTSVTTIGPRAFGSCDGLKSVILPKNVTKIDDRAFYRCAGLTDLFFDGNAPYIGADALPENVTLYANASAGGWTDSPAYDAAAGTWNGYPLVIFSEGLVFEEHTDYCIVTGVGSCRDSEIVIPAIYNAKPVTAIGPEAFSWCTNLKSVVIPESVTEIGTYAFGGNRLESVEIPEHVTTIGDYAFYWCVDMTDVSIQEGVATIGERAFYNCTSLTSLTLPASVGVIMGEAFAYCGKLTDVYFAGDAPAITLSSFDKRVTLHANADASGWTNSPYYEAENGTWLGYRLVVGQPSTDVSSVNHQAAPAMMQDSQPLLSAAPQAEEAPAASQIEPQAKEPDTEQQIIPPESAEAAFEDITEADYCFDAVRWAQLNKVTGGTDATHFSPNMSVTRAQVVTFLWRAAGCPAADCAMNMNDVKSGDYFADAVRWALAEGITKGVSDTAFGADAVCTRAQIVTFLARFAGVEDSGTESGFSDVRSTDYFAAAVKWAGDNGVTEGTSAATFSPNDNCTRAQAVTFLWRWMVK